MVDAPHSAPRFLPLRGALLSQGDGIDDFSVYDGLSLILAAVALIYAVIADHKSSRPFVQVKLKVEPWYDKSKPDVERRMREGRFHGLQFSIWCRNNGPETAEIQSVTIQATVGPSFKRPQGAHGRSWHLRPNTEGRNDWHAWHTEEPVESWYSLPSLPQVRAVVKFANGHQRQTEWMELPAVSP